ncbi:ATP-dependent DNA ligase [Halopseudomonas oceani]|uniref:DNA ligase n=1 Tax=Halopseudomonas oceani TaxID=1708783 RepID=A0A2P4EYJ4_9GAMM|nr:DNA ligase [Halopseudomonas oceani]POB05529.1 DNA ligase [Halopseudomonas oceani]GGE56619.1 ATP-dependent DNA ligase [Halopseudomonas oceani]
MASLGRRLLALVVLFCAALSASANSSLMLAEVYRGEVNVADYWVSEKLDGVRARWDGQHLYSRGGYRINAPGAFTRGWPQTVMDGELWLGRGRFDEVSALARRTQSDIGQWQSVRFMVFDLPEHGGVFSERVTDMAELARLGLPTLQPVAQARVADVDELDWRLEAVVAAGGEGLMLHRADARYLPGRHDALLKYKPYDDAEARVVGYTAGQGKYLGQVGALIVENGEGKRFRLGSGLSDADRADPPALGSWVTYRYNGMTATGLPRFARYLRQRPTLGDSDGR